ncbi:MAG: hypothetical protein IKX94_04300, partial [Muribaculaceae bacterium]|nr:hypothetical protein [Muribaculaceae bacterium]
MAPRGCPPQKRCKITAYFLYDQTFPRFFSVNRQKGPITSSAQDFIASTRQRHFVNNQNIIDVSLFYMVDFP